MKIDRNYSYLAYVLFFGLWVSIGSDPYNFLFIFENEISISLLNFNEFVNFIRAIIPIIILIICLYLIIKKKLFKEQNKFLIIILLIQIIQLISTYTSNYSAISSLEDRIDHIGRYHWIISSIASIFLFMLMDKIERFEFKKIFFISIFFLFFMVIFFSYKNLLDFIFQDSKSSLYSLNVFRESAYFLNHEFPRVTGISRSIIFLYVIIYFFNINSQNLIKLLNNIILIILGSLLFLYQSRFGIISYLFINIIFLLSASNKIKSVRFILSIFLIQILLSFLISNSRIYFNNYIKAEQNNEFKILNENKDDKISHFRVMKDLSKKGTDQIENMLFSGRLKIWRDSFEYINKNPLIGYGSMSDRILLNQSRKKNNQIINPISNAYLYSLLSGGIISLFLFLYFWVNIKKEIFRTFKLKTIENNYSKIGHVLILLIFLRCLIENSIMLFGVDYLLIINSLYLVKKI